MYIKMITLLILLLQNHQVSLISLVEGESGVTEENLFQNMITPHQQDEYSKQNLFKLQLAVADDDTSNSFAGYHGDNTNKSEVVEDPLKKIVDLLNEIVQNAPSELKAGIAEQSNKPMQIISGQLRRGELFFNKPAVHLPAKTFMRNYWNHLKVTQDYMQTAINAFAIFRHGTVDDIHRLPAEYVLSSSRTIAMMIMPYEKFVATWFAVKQNIPTINITYEVLEQYRPLFKYLRGREMASLNLMDDKILSYIGTHMDLNRHQLATVASYYVKLNPAWKTPKYLNLMNNLICGVAIPLMRDIPDNTYLQLTSEVFSHLRACDPLHRRFYLGKMTKSEVYGKSFSWRAQDVSHLGLLVAELRGTELSAINPTAMAGMTPHVLKRIPAENLMHIKHEQMRYLSAKCQNILVKKLRIHNFSTREMNTASSTVKYTIIYLIPFIVQINILL